MDEYRDYMGFIDVTEIDPRAYGRRNYVFDYNGETYYYKKNKRIDSCYKELIAAELLKKLNLPYVEYDLACNGEEIGVISKSFLKKGEKIIYIEDILIPGEQDIVRTSLEGIWNSLEIRYKDKGLVKDLMDQIVTMFLFDVIIANYDRHVGNIVLIESNGKLRLSPIFDNEMGLDRASIQHNYYSLSTTKDDPCDCNVLYEFLRYSDSSYREKLESFLPVIEETSLLDIFDKIEINTKAKIPRMIKIEILEAFNENRNNIKNIISKTKVKVLKCVK